VPRRPTVAGAPLRVSPTFLAIAILFGLFTGRDVAHTQFVAFPVMPSGDWRAMGAWLETHDPLAGTITHPAAMWTLVAGLGGALVYFLSILAHELGHLAAARVVGVDVIAIELDYAGGFVEMDDDDRLTAGRLGAVIGAGPLVTALITLVTWAALELLGWPLTGMPDLNTGAGVTAGRILSLAFVINLGMLALNLLPFRSLDGGQLLAAARLRLARG
jgi:Zn-dependent protease